MTDISSLTSASRPAATNPALAEAARGFEQIFLRQLISAMRAGSHGDALFGSAAEDQFRDLFDARVAESLSARSAGNQTGLGIGALLVAQLERGRAP